MSESSRGEDRNSFDACFVDDDAVLCEVSIGDTTFKLRSITIGEYARVQQMSRVAPVQRPEPNYDDIVAFASSIGKTPETLTEGERCRADQLSISSASEATVDVWRLQQLTVGAALGAWQTFGYEGWSKDRPVNMESVARLKRDVVMHLYTKHQSFFRPVALDDTESERSDSMGV